MATSSVVPIRRRTPEDSAASAHRVLDAALAVHDQWAHRNIAARAAADLDDALEEYQAVESGAVHWASLYPHLRGEADPHGEALLKLAEEACMAMAILLMTIAATSSRELADAIKAAATPAPTDQTGPQGSAADRADAPRPQP